MMRKMIAFIAALMLTISGCTEQDNNSADTIYIPDITRITDFNQTTFTPMLETIKEVTLTPVPTNTASLNLETECDAGRVEFFNFNGLVGEAIFLETQYNDAELYIDGERTDCYIRKIGNGLIFDILDSGLPKNKVINFEIHLFNEENNEAEKLTISDFYYSHNEDITNILEIESIRYLVLEDADGDVAE